MNVEEILALATNFECMVKHADIRANMAKRIMFSLLSHLVPQGEQGRIYTTKGMVDFTALKQMIPGAREVLKYGLMAVVEEAQHYDNADIVQEVIGIYKSGDIKATLEYLVTLFGNGRWMTMYGGSPWAKISAALLDVQNSLDAYEKAKTDYDYDAQASALMEMVAYLNVLDGLAHNGGPIMEKMLTHERFDRDPEAQGEGDHQREAEVLRMMDAKELKDPDDVLQEIMPALEQSDAPLTMKDWIHAARQRRHDYQGTVEDRKQKLRLIRIKKQMAQSLHTHEIDVFKQTIQSWSMLPDNVMLSRASVNGIRFWMLATVGSNFLKLKELPNEMRAPIMHKLRSVKILAALKGNEQEMKERLISLGLPRVRQIINDCYDLIGLMEKSITLIGE